MRNICLIRPIREMPKRFTILFAISILSCQACARESVEEIAEQFFQTLQSQDLSDIAEYFHPDALKEFKKLLLPVYRDEVQCGRRHLLDVSFGTQSSLDSIEELDDDQFMNGVMNMLMAIPEAARPDFKREILGTVEEGEDVHLLIRLTVGTGEFSRSEIEVFSFTQYGDTWKLQLNNKMKALAVELMPKR